MSFYQAIRKLLPRPLTKFLQARRKMQSHVRSMHDLLLERLSLDLRREHPNPLNRHGAKSFSQADEDGITVEILRRLGCLDKGVFAEFGVGNGMENNTLILKALGWKGFWVGGEDLAYTIEQPRSSFSFTRAWIDLDNIATHATNGLKDLGEKALDVISLDLDGNDIYLVERLLETGFVPALFIVEYNAKFMPPVRWQIAYNPTHTHQGDDYFGASLCSFVDLFSKHGFRLVCCNADTGSNAFFVHERYSEHFTDVPTDIHKLYMPPRYHVYSAFGHPPAVVTVAHLFRDNRER